MRYDKYRGWLPEQQQLAASVGPVVLQSRTFDEVEFFTWNVFAPRLGVTYDLTGDGRTVLKGNYGLIGTTLALRCRTRQPEYRRQSGDLLVERRERRSPLAARRRGRDAGLRHA